MNLNDLKLQLFDSIIGARKSNDIVGIKQETDAIYERLKSISKLDGKFNSELFKSNVYTAISSYYFNPDFSLEDRIPIIDGMIFYGDIFVKNESIMENIGVGEQITLCIGLLEKYKNMIELSEKYKHNICLGIAISAKLNNVSKEK